MVKSLLYNRFLGFSVHQRTFGALDGSFPLLSIAFGETGPGRKHTAGQTTCTRRRVRAAGRRFVRGRRAAARLAPGAAGPESTATGKRAFEVRASDGVRVAVPRAGPAGTEARARGQGPPRHRALPET